MAPDVAVEGDAWLHKTLSPSSCVENACKGRFRSPKRIDVVISRGKSLELIELEDDGSFRTCSSQLVLSSIYQIKMLPSSSSASHKKVGLDLLLMTTSSGKLSVLKHASSIGRFVAICHVDLSTSPSAGQSGAYHDLGRHMALSPCSCCLALASLAGTVVIISVQTMLNHTAGHDDSSNKQCPDHDLGADACEPPQRQQERGALADPAAADSNDIMEEVIDHQCAADDADIPQGSMIPWWHHHCSTEPSLLPLSACNPSWGLMVSKREVLLQQMGEHPQHAPAEGGSNPPTPPALPLFEEAGDEDVAVFEEAAGGEDIAVADDDPTDGAVDHDVDEDDNLVVLGGGLLDGGVAVEDDEVGGHGQIDEDEAAEVVVATSTAAVSAEAVADSPGMVAEEDHDGNAHGEENNDILMDTDNDDVAFIAVAHLGDDEVTMPQQQQLAFQLSRHSNQQEEAATADDGDLYADEQLGHHSAAEEVEDEMMEDSVNVLPGMYWADEGLPQLVEERHAEEVEEADINNVMLEVLQQQVPGQASQALGTANEPVVLPQDQLYVQQGGDVAVASSDDNNVSGRDGGITDEWDEGVGVQGFEHRYEASSYLLHPDHDHEGGNVGDDVAAPSSASAPVDAATALGGASSSLSHLQQELAVATAAAHVALDNAVMVLDTNSSLSYDLVQQELAAAAAAASAAVAAAAAVVDMIMADEVAVAEGRLVEISWEDAGVAYERFFGDTASSSGSSGGNNLSSSEDERANKYRSMHEEGDDDDQHVVLDMCTVLGIQFIMNYREPHDDLSVIDNSSDLFELPAGQGVDCEGHCLHKGDEAAAASNHHQTDYFLAVLLQRPSVSRDEDAAGPLGGQPSSSVNQQHINELRLLHHSVSRKRGVMGYSASPHLSSLTHITFEPRSCNNDADGDDDYEAADNYNAPISIRREGQHAGNCVDILGYLSHLESIPNNPTGVLVFGERGVLAVHFDLKNIPPPSLPPKSAAGNNNSSGHVVGAVAVAGSSSATMSHATNHRCCILPLQQAGVSSRPHLIQRVCCKLPLMKPSTLPEDGLELAVVTISAEHSGFRLQTGCSGEQRGAVVLEAMSCSSSSSSSSRGGIIGLEPHLQRMESKTGSCVWSATCWLADSATSMQVEHSSGSALQIINESKDAVIANRDSQLLYCTGAGRLFCLYVQSRSMMTLMQKPLTSVASGMQRPASFLYGLHPEGRVLYAEQMGDLLVLQLNTTASSSVPDPFIRGHSTAIASSSASSSVLTNVVPEVRLLYCLPQLGAVLDLAGVNTSRGDNDAAAITGGAIQLHAVTASLPSIANSREAGHGQHGGVITKHDDDDDDDDDAPSTLPQAVLCRLHTAYPSQTVLAFSPSLRSDDSYQSPAATPLKSFPIRGSAFQQPPFSSLLLLSYFHCTRAVQLLAAPAMQKKTSEMQQQQRFGGMRDVSDVLPGLVVHEPTLAAGVVSKDSLLAQVTPSGFTLVEVSTESRDGRADSPTTTQTGPAVEDDGSCGLTGMLADIDLKSKEGELSHAINSTEMKGSRQQKPRNKIRSASSNPGSWHPPPHLLGSSFMQQHVVVADVCPGCVVMAVTPSRSLHVVTTFSSNASSASPDHNSAIIPTQVEGLLTRMKAGGHSHETEGLITGMKAGGHSHETLCDRNQEVKPVTGDVDSLAATAAAASSAAALPVLDSRVLAPSSGSGAASSNPMTSRKRARQGTHLSTGCVIPLKQEVSCLQVKPLPSAAAGHYLVLLGHYGTYNGSVDDDDSGMNSSHPGSTLMMLAPRGTHNSAAVASDPMPTMDWGVISEGLPPDVLSQLGPPWGAAGSTMMMVPESVLLLEPKPLRALPVPSLHPSGPLASIESVNWLVGYRQGLLALYQYRPRAAPCPPQLVYSTNAMGSMATLSTETSGDPASAQLLWCMQLGDLPLSLSPLTSSPPPYRGDMSQGKDDLDMEARSGSDDTTTAVALSVGRSMSVISISPLNNRLHAQTVALQGVASASCLDIAMQALGSKKLPVRACPGAGAGTTSIQQAPAPVTTTPPLDLSHNSGGLCRQHHAVVIHHSGTWSVEALGQGLNFAGSSRSSSGSSSTATNRFSCHPPHTVPIQQLPLGSLLPERLLPHPPSQSLLMLSTAPLSRTHSGLGQCQKDDIAGCAGAHQFQVLGRPRPGRGMLDMRLGETRHEGLSDGRLVEPSTGKDCDRGATAAVGSRINVLDPLTGASLARYHCLEAETATCMETWRTTYQITLGSHFRSSSLTAACNDSHLTTSRNQQPRDQQPLLGAPGGLQSHAITLSNRTTASSMGGEAPDNTARILGGGATSRPGTGSRHATGGGSTRGPAAAAITSSAGAPAEPPSNDDVAMTHPDADHGLEAHDHTERRQEWKISQDWMMGQLLGEFLSPRVQRAFMNRPLSNLQDDLIILATSRNCLSSTEGEGGGASTSNKVQSRITVLRLVRLPGGRRTSDMNSQILSTEGHLRSSVSMRDDTKQLIEAGVGSGQASIRHLEGSSKQSFPSNQSKAAHQRAVLPHQRAVLPHQRAVLPHQRAVLPHHQPTALSNKGRNSQKKIMDSSNKDGDSAGPWVLQVMARTEVAYNPVSAVCGIHGTDVLLCTAGRRLVVYRLKSKLSVHQACVEEGVEKMRGSAVEIIQTMRQEDAAAAPSGFLSAEGRARELLGEGHSSAGAFSHSDAAAAASVHDSDRRSPHLDGPSSTAFLLPADAAAHSRGDLPPPAAAAAAAAAAATRPAARSHNLERTAWAHMISPARQLSVQPGGLHISVLHECGRVTIWELTRSSDVEALQVLAANSLTRNITSIHMFPGKQMSCSYPHSTCLHEDSSIPLGSAMGLTSRSDVPSSHLTSYSHGRSVDAVDSRPRVRNPPDAVDAPAAQICSSTAAPNARRREALPSVLTLDDGGCFAALSLPDKTLCPQRNLEASYLFNTDASHARMTMVSSSTTRKAQCADSALSLEGGAAAAWAGWLKSLAKSAADPSFSNERVSSFMFSLISLAKIESAANGDGCLVPPLFDSAGSSSAMFISDAAGQVCCLSRVHPQAAWVLLRLQAALMEACPSARPLSGVDFAEHRYTFRRHQVRLPFQQSCRRVVDSEVLSLFLDLPRHQRLKVVSCFWRSAVRELSSGDLEDVPANHATPPTNTCKSSEPFRVKEDDLNLMEGSSSLQLRAGLCDLEFLERRVVTIVDLIVQAVLMAGGV